MCPVRYVLTFVFYTCYIVKPGSQAIQTEVLTHPIQNPKPLSEAFLRNSDVVK